MSAPGLRRLTSLGAAGLLALSAVGASAQQGTLRGLVRDGATDAPVASARVTLPGSGAAVTADSLGRFTVPGLAPGDHTVRIERLGYVTLDAPVRVAAGEAAERTFLLRPVPTAVAGVTVEARPVSPRMAGFEARRATGIGRYLTQSQLAGQTDRRFSDVVRRVAPGVQAERGNGSEMYLVNARGIPAGALRKPERCYVQVVVDGVRVYGQGQTPTSGGLLFDINSLQVQDLAGVEYYGSPSSTPPEFRTGTAQCGTLVVWTRDGVTR